MWECVASAVELGDELAVGGEVIVTVLELEIQVDDLLFGVVGAADAELPPDLLAQGLAEAGGAGVGGRQIGLKRRPADGRSPAAGDRGRLGGLALDGPN